METCRKVVPVDIYTFLLGVVEQIYHVGLQSREAEIEFAACNGRVWELECVPVACLCGVVDVDSAGVGESHSSCALVETFACRVVVGSSHYAELSIAEHLDYMAVTAACHKAEVRRFKVGEGQIIGGDMTCDMMNRYQRLSRGHCKSLCEAYSHKESAYKSRGVCNGDTVKV